MPSELATTLAASEEDRLLQAEALVRAYCGWHIAPVKVSTWAIGADARTTLLPTLRLVDVLEVLDGETPVDTRRYSFDAGGIFRLHVVQGDYDPLMWPDASWEWTDYGLAGRGRSLRVTARHGFDEPPAEVTAVVQAVAQRAIDNPNGYVREQTGPFGVTYSQTAFNQAVPLVLLADEKQTLGRYRLPPRP